jgi:uncharacterized RDD family membrane protein YckC
MTSAPKPPEQFAPIPVPPSQPPTDKKKELEDAGFWLRCGAYLFDSAILMIIVWVVDALSWAIFSAKLSEFFMALINTGLGATDVGLFLMFVTWIASMILHTIVIWIVALLIGWVYYMGFEGTGHHATPGKRLFGLRVVDMAGGDIGPFRASLRHMGKFIGYAPLLAASSVVFMIVNVGGAESVDGFVVFVVAMGLLATPTLLAICYGMAGLTKYHQALHDRVAGCRVIIYTSLEPNRLYTVIGIAVVAYFAVSRLA